MRATLDGRDALGLLPTGGGKSLTYLLPAHLLDRPVLVVSPLIALMDDQLARARGCGLRAEALAGPMSAGARAGILAAWGAGRLDLLLTAPERLEPDGPLRRTLDAHPPALLVVDEAHCLISWGWDFRPGYRRLEGLAPRLGVPTLALTATATPPVRRALVSSLPLRDPVRVELSFRRPNLSFRTRRVASPEDRWRSLRRLLDAVDGPALVYASTRGDVERLASALRARGRPSAAFHAGMSPDRRAEVQRRYLGGDLDLIVATCAFGMGVDKPDVRRVVHWSPPDSLEAYYQEAGRGGRDGGPADAHLLWHPSDLPPLRRRIAASFPHPVRLAAAVRTSGPWPAGASETARDRFLDAGGGWGALREAARLRRAARRRLAAVRRYLHAADPLDVMLDWLGEPGRL